MKQFSIALFFFVLSACSNPPAATAEAALQTLHDFCDLERQCESVPSELCTSAQDVGVRQAFTVNCGAPLLTTFECLRNTAMCTSRRLVASAECRAPLEATNSCLDRNSPRVESVPTQTTTPSPMPSPAQPRSRYPTSVTATCDAVTASLPFNSARECIDYLVALYTRCTYANMDCP